MNRRSRWVVAGILVLAASAGGCGAPKATLDHRAAVMCGLADKINAGTADELAANALDVAWAVENERRAAVNLADWAHWRKPTHPYPAKRPTALPWVPVDDDSAGQASRLSANVEQAACPYGSRLSGD